MAEASSNAGQQPNAKAEMQAEEWFDLLPIEKKLIGYSLSLGILLLIVFVLGFKVL
ncbi:hypothetical protein DEAC_c42680 [Desulfosporosinus acididurans]|uniref:Uncharacterized protein n=1 Tax=Desulfosporosinus acididurans TaxID=476652 RepID=A0A0J1FK52_9FIRM|nr:hypothetical protein [Desulfosporosinus acididurans]KLU63812.1 hypothetical protein DEAC_c42680 [Desulfosporosinus acididurans]